MKIRTNTFWFSGMICRWPWCMVIPILLSMTVCFSDRCIYLANYLLDMGLGPLGTSWAAAPYCRFLELLLCFGCNSMAADCCVEGGGCRRSRLTEEEEYWWSALVIFERSVGRRRSKRVTSKRSTINSNRTNNDFFELSQSALLAAAID